MPDVQGNRRAADEVILAAELRHQRQQPTLGVV